MNLDHWITWVDQKTFKPNDGPWTILEGTEESGNDLGSHLKDAGNNVLLHFGSMPSGQMNDIKRFPGSGRGKARLHQSLILACDPKRILSFSSETKCQVATLYTILNPASNWRRLPSDVGTGHILFPTFPIPYLCQAFPSGNHPGTRLLGEVSLHLQHSSPSTKIFARDSDVSSDQFQ